MNSKKFCIFLIIINSSLFFNSCKKEPPSVYEKAARFVKIHSSEEYLKNEDGVFLMIEGEHKAADWVSYFFSVMSTRNWISENDEFAEYTSGPKLPSGIILSNNKINKEAKKPQLVVRTNDDNNLIIVEGYEYPPKSIVFKNEWEFNLGN
jgi:hypothetical protein